MFSGLGGFHWLLRHMSSRHRWLGNGLWLRRGVVFFRGRSHRTTGENQPQFLSDVVVDGTRVGFLFRNAQLG
jgi:hypothetical protein